MKGKTRCTGNQPQCSLIPGEMKEGQKKFENTLGLNPGVQLESALVRPPEERTILKAEVDHDISRVVACPGIYVDKPWG